MYRMHYEVMRPHFNFLSGSDPKINNRARLCYSDTDSLVYMLRGLKGRSVYRDLHMLQREHDIFDLSELQDMDSDLG